LQKQFSKSAFRSFKTVFLRVKNRVYQIYQQKEETFLIFLNSMLPENLRLE